MYVSVCDHFKKAKYHLNIFVQNEKGGPSEYSNQGSPRIPAYPEGGPCRNPIQMDSNIHKSHSRSDAKTYNFNQPQELGSCSLTNVWHITLQKPPLKITMITFFLSERGDMNKHTQKKGIFWGHYDNCLKLLPLKKHQGISYIQEEGP